MQHQFCFIGEYAGDCSWAITDVGELVHLLKILRLKKDDLVLLTDGKGRLCEAKISSIDKNQVEALCAEEPNLHPAPSPRSVLLAGALKHGEFDEVIPPLVELGVSELWIFLGDGREKAAVGEKARKRWDKIALQSIKQCKRPWALQIRVFSSLEDAFKTIDQSYSFTSKFLCVPQWAQDKFIEQSLAKDVLMIVGSEAGFSSEEARFLASRNDLELIVLSPYVLRAKTCLIASAAWLRSRLR